MGMKKRSPKRTDVHVMGCLGHMIDCVGETLFKVMTPYDKNRFGFVVHVLSLCGEYLSYGEGDADSVMRAVVNNYLEDIDPKRELRRYVELRRYIEGLGAGYDQDQLR